MKNQYFFRKNEIYHDLFNTTIEYNLAKLLNFFPFDHHTSILNQCQHLEGFLNFCISIIQNFFEFRFYYYFTSSFELPNESKNILVGI